MINLRDILSLPVLLVNFYGYVASLTRLETRARTLSYTTLYSYNKFRDLGSDKDSLYSGLNNNKILCAKKKNFFVLSLANSKVQDLTAESCSHVWEMVSFILSPMRFHGWRLIATGVAACQKKSSQLTYESFTLFCNL